MGSFRKLMSVPLTVLLLLIANPAPSYAVPAGSPPAAPTPTSPADGSVLPSLPFWNGLDTTLTWDNPPDTSQVHIQVIPYHNDGPGANVYLGAPASSFLLPAPPRWYGLLPDMTYTWRVRVSDARTGVGLEDPSWGPWAQRTLRTPKLSDQFATQPVAPTAGAHSVSRTPTLQWGASMATVFYFEVRLSKDPTFNTDPATTTAPVYWNLVHGGITNSPHSYTVPSQFPLEAGTVYSGRCAHGCRGTEFQ